MVTSIGSFEPKVANLRGRHLGDSSGCYIAFASVAGRLGKMTLRSDIKML